MRNSLRFGLSVFEHACGGELQREESPRADGLDLFCGRCGASFSLTEWDEAQRELTARGALLRQVYGRRWREVATN